MSALTLSDKQIIGQKFKQLRIENNYTQKELGERIGVSFQTIQKYEKGLITPNLDIITSYCTLFTLKASYFLDGVFPLNTGSESYEEQTKRIRETIIDLGNELDSIKPFEIPVYAQRDHKEGVDPKLAYDHIYWSHQRLANRDITIMQVQTNSMYPYFMPNDRIIIDKGLEIAEGFAIIEHGKPRRTFKSVGSTLVLITKEGDDFLYSNTRKNGIDVSTKPQILKKNMYKGMVIQMIRSLDYLGSSQSYETLPIPTEKMDQ